MPKNAAPPAPASREARPVTTRLMASARTMPLLLLTSLLGGCATTTGPAPVAYARSLPIGVELAAALAAGALRAELPFADPLPGAAGAPVTRRVDGSFELCYEQRADGAWLPAATARLLVVMPRQLPASPQPRLAELPAPGMPGFGGATTMRVLLHFTGGPTACHVTGTLPHLADHDLVGLFEGTWDQALAPTTQAPGLRNDNLRALVAHHLLHAANQPTAAGAGDHAAAAVLQAQALGAEGPALDLALGQRAIARGDEGAAAHHLWQMALTTDDPRGRQQAARLARLATAPPVQRSSRLRAVAAGPAAGGDHAAAHRLGHSARRLDPRPVADYQLLAELHRRAGDPPLALACALLAHEYAGGALPTPARSAALAAGGLGHLAPVTDRTTTGPTPAAVARSGESVVPSTAAVPPR